MKRRFGFLLMPFLGLASSLALSACSSPSSEQNSEPIVASSSGSGVEEQSSGATSEETAPAVDYSSDKWTDYSGHSLWAVDSELSTFDFYSNVSAEDDAKRWDKAFTQNLYLTDQFDTRGAKVTMEATFQGTTSSQDIIDSGNGEVHLGIVPWYKDSRNWVICYAKFGCTDDATDIKNGHLTDFVVYVRLNNSVHVEYYAKDDGNTWVSASDASNSEWHSAWPDRENGNKNPSTLQDSKPDPSEETKVYVRKTRKTYAGKDCDSFYVKVNDYELNFGMDNFMFSGLKEAEDADESFVPKIGFYLFGTRKATVKDVAIDISHEEVLPIPTVEPLSDPTTSGTINKKIKVPDFAAYDNNGSSISYTITLKDPDGETAYLDGDDYFIPTKPGDYQVKVSATDKDGLAGEYTYTVRVKNGTTRIDADVYDDVLTPLAKDTSIPVAYAIFISVPILIAAYIGLKVFLYFRKKKKGE